jgi:ABC-type polysaccharide/polyol phosphate export permease
MLINSATPILSFRMEGVWNRTLLSGVKLSEIYAANLLQCACYSLITTTEMICSIIIIVEVESKDILIAIVLLFECSIVGFLIGLTLSIVSNDFAFVGYVGIAILLIFFILSGIVW